MAYDIFEHKHRFSSWAAARASQVHGAITMKDLREAIEHCGIVEFLRKPDAMQTEQARFNDLHRQWCRTIIAFLAKKGINVSFGRAAKLVAIYLKSMVVISGDSDFRLARVAQPCAFR